MTTHDFRPGDVVEFAYHDDSAWRTGVVTDIGTVDDSCLRARVTTNDGAEWSMYEHEFHRMRLVSRPKPAITLQRPGEWSAGDPDPPTEHPSRSRAASSLRAASASLTTAIDHLTRAGEVETYPGQTVIRIRTASEETQACIQHATMALYWLLHERLGS